MNQRSSPFNFPVEEYDKFALFSPTEAKDYVFVPIHIYGLFKGIALDRINLASKKVLEEKDLTP